MTELPKQVMRIVQQADKVPGWMTRSELAWLSRTASALPEGVVWLEVGSWCGRSSLAVGLSLPKNATLHCVDRWRNFGDLYVDHVVEPDWPREQFQRTMAALMQQRSDIKVYVHEIDSEKLAETIEHGSCDVAFVDGDHSFDAVLRDCRQCELLLTPGGLLCGHDYRQHTCPDVERAVVHLYGGNFRAESTTIWRRGR